MGRLATADEIAALVIYLASEEVSDNDWLVHVLSVLLSCSLLLLLGLHSKLMVDGVFE